MENVDEQVKLEKMHRTHIPNITGSEFEELIIKAKAHVEKLPKGCYVFLQIRNLKIMSKEKWKNKSR